jgi:hypothetical protein
MTTGEIQGGSLAEEATEWCTSGLIQDKGVCSLLWDGEYWQTNGGDGLAHSNS